MLPKKKIIIEVLIATLLLAGILAASIYWLKITLYPPPLPTAEPYHKEEVWG